MESKKSRFELQRGKAQGVLITLVAIVLVAGLGYVFATASKNNQPADNPVVATPDMTGQTTTTTSATPPVPTVPTTPVTTTNVYKDGTYSATGSYISPGGHQGLQVTLTLTNDVVTDASVVSGAIDGTSRRYQSMFISGYKQYVIGKKISTLNVGAVSGSSLTPQGFNDAVTQIEAEAKA
jgi:uncharacterized protein with FMN-binding domain